MGTTQCWKLCEPPPPPPQKAKNKLVNSLSLGFGPRAIASWFRFGLGKTTGQAIHTSICFNLIQRWTGEEHSSPQDSPSERKMAGGMGWGRGNGSVSCELTFDLSTHPCPLGASRNQTP